MVDLQFTEIIVTLRDYHTLLDQMSVVLISAAAILSYKFINEVSSKWGLILPFLAFISGVISIILGFMFRSKLIDIIPGLLVKENPTSLTDPALRALTLWQIAILSLGGILLIIGAFFKPKKVKING